MDAKFLAETDVILKPTCEVPTENLISRNTLVKRRTGCNCEQSVDDKRSKGQIKQGAHWQKGGTEDKRHGFKKEKDGKSGGIMQTCVDINRSSLLNS